MPREVSPQWAAILDALIDAPAAGSGDLVQRTAQVQQHVLRNLENVLNSRRTPEPPPRYLKHACDSLVMVGLPDFTGSGFDDDAQRKALCTEIDKAIRAFEPRLRNVEVRLESESNATDRILHFRILGDLQVEPQPQRVVYESQLDCANGLITVSAE